MRPTRVMIWQCPKDHFCCILERLQTAQLHPELTTKLFLASFPRPSFPGRAFPTLMQASIGPSSGTPPPSLLLFSFGAAHQHPKQRPPTSYSGNRLKSCQLPPAQGSGLDFNAETFFWNFPPCVRSGLAFESLQVTSSSQSNFLGFLTDTTLNLKNNGSSRKKKKNTASLVSTVGLIPHLETSGQTEVPLPGG